MRGTCLRGDSRVSTTRGVKAIKDIQPGDYVYSMEGGKLVTRRVNALLEQGEKPVYRVQLSTREIAATDNHPLPVFEIDHIAWKTVSELEEGDAVLTLRSLWLTPERSPLTRSHTEKTDPRALHKHADTRFFDIAYVKSVTPDGSAPTYDIEVEGSHNFIANGVVVHNSMATPHVAGLIAYAYDRGLVRTAADVKELLKGDGRSKSPETGYGLIDLSRLGGEGVAPPIEDAPRLRSPEVTLRWDPDRGFAEGVTQRATLGVKNPNPISFPTRIFLRVGEGTPQPTQKITDVFQLPAESALVEKTLEITLPDERAHNPYPVDVTLKLGDLEVSYELEDINVFVPAPPPTRPAPPTLPAPTPPTPPAPAPPPIAAVVVEQITWEDTGITAGDWVVGVKGTVRHVGGTDATVETTLEARHQESGELQGRVSPPDRFTLSPGDTGDFDEAIQVRANLDMVGTYVLALVVRDVSSGSLLDVRLSPPRGFPEPAFAVGDIVRVINTYQAGPVDDRRVAPDFDVWQYAVTFRGGGGSGYIDQSELELA